MIIKEMNKKIPPFDDAIIGKEFDSKSILLKSMNSRLTYAFIIFLFLGAAFVDLALSGKLPIFLGLLFTFMALGFYFFRNYKHFNEQWTYTRVAAESIKSEWYKYTVGGGDYPCNKDVGEDYYKDLFEKNIQDKISEYRKNIINIDGSPIDFELTIDANTVSYRALSFAQRLGIYKDQRIKDQLSWYEKKSIEMSKKETKYRWGFIAIVIIGLFFGATQLMDLASFSRINESDFFSIAIALAFALESTNSLFQHERLSIAYKKSAVDLTESLNKINDSNNDVKTDENVFSEFVEDVENRISNEHKSWSLTTNSKNLPNF